MSDEIKSEPRNIDAELTAVKIQLIAALETQNEIYSQNIRRNKIEIQRLRNEIGLD